MSPIGSSAKSSSLTNFITKLIEKAEQSEVDWNLFKISHVQRYSSNDLATQADKTSQNGASCLDVRVYSNVARICNRRRDKEL